MSDTYALLGRILEDCAHEMSCEDQERLHDLMQTYEPYTGDPPQDAQERKITNATCGNCHFQFPAMSAPADLSRAARSGMRHAACPRCYSNDRIFLS